MAFDWRKFLKKLLEMLLREVEKPPEQKAVIRSEESIWKKEIKIPASLISAICAILFFFVIVFEIGFSWTKVTALVIFLSLILAFIVYYVKKVEKALLEDSESVTLLGLIFVLAAFLMVVFKEWLPPISCPIAAMAVLIGLLLSKRIAIIAAVILSLFVAILNDFSLEYFIFHSISSLAGVAFVAKIKTRGDIAKLCFKLGGVNVLAAIIIHFFRLWPVQLLLANIVWGATGGIFSGILVLIILPVLESLFSKITNIKLLELADSTRPLLKKLMVEAPGTYHHSLLMASIAEQAAETIGANPLLARVQAYYHDVGKLAHPEYFIENQKVNENPHSSLTPAMSGLIVSSHVKEGVALAKQYDLDKVIIDAIQEHHGTSLMHYFYHRALEQGADTNPDDFRYPGPKPRSKETAILMVADAAEAASRTLEDPSPGQLKDTVEKVINNKFTDNQFSECPITLHDLNAISESIVSTLGGIYHARIEYKEIQESEQKKS